GGGSAVVLLGITSGPRGLVGSGLTGAGMRPRPCAVVSITSDSKVCTEVKALVPTVVVQAERPAPTSRIAANAADRRPVKSNAMKLPFSPPAEAYSRARRVRPDSGSNWFTPGLGRASGRHQGDRATAAPPLG